MNRKRSTKLRTYPKDTASAKSVSEPENGPGNEYSPSLPLFPAPIDENAPFPLTENVNSYRYTRSMAEEAYCFLFRAEPDQGGYWLSQPNVGAIWFPTLAEVRQAIERGELPRSRLP